MVKEVTSVMDVAVTGSDEISEDNVKPEEAADCVKSVIGGIGVSEVK